MLERAGSFLGNKAELTNFIPKVHAQELELVKRELDGQHLCITFDGTTRVGEVLAVVARYCTEDFTLQSRLIALKTTAKHMAGNELSALLLRTFMLRIGPSSLDNILAVSRDSCSTNGAAVRSLKLSAMPSILDLLCFSHTLHNCAKNMDLPYLEMWLTPWFQVMAHSHRAAQLWREAIGVSPILYSKVRWWSRMECANQIAMNFSALEHVVRKLEAEGVGESSTRALRAVLDNTEDCFGLQLDLAVLLDSSIFCEKTYRFEGDRLELFIVAEDIEEIREKGKTLGENINMRSLPNVAALLRRSVALKIGTPVYDWFGPPYNGFYKGKVSQMPARNAAPPLTYMVTFEDKTSVEFGEQELRNALDVRSEANWKRAQDAVAGAYEYLEKRLTDDPTVDQPYRLKENYAVFKAVRAFDPGYAKGDHVTPAVVDGLSILPWLGDDDATLQRLHEECAAYVSAAKASNLNFVHQDLDKFTSEVLTFWQQLANSGVCKTWVAQARRVLCLTPNSAASERVFSRLSGVFQKEQLTSLSDYIEGSIMLGYNKRQLG